MQGGEEEKEIDKGAGKISLKSAFISSRVVRKFAAKFDGLPGENISVMRISKKHLSIR